jgi:hypothetical protein
VPVGASIAAAGSIAKSAISANAAGQATKAAKQANQANLQFLNGVYDDAKGNLNPTIQGGIKSGNTLSGLLGVGGDPVASQKAWDQYRNSTNYQFQFDQGTQAVKTANAPAFNSGATAKALINYGQGQAGSALAGYESLLAGQQSLGAQSALGLGGIGTNIAQQVIGTNNATAGVKGSSALYTGNALGGGIDALTGLFGNMTGASSYGGSSGSGALPGHTTGAI